MKIVVKSIRGNGVKVKQVFVKPEGMKNSDFELMVRDWIYPAKTRGEVKSISLIENY